LSKINGLLLTPPDRKKNIVVNITCVKIVVGAETSNIFESEERENKEMS
jgi:hypothetical protein